MVKPRKINSTWYLLFFVFFASPVQGTFGQQYDWLNTARIFMIDAYYPPFAPKLEFDAEKLAQTMQDMHVNVVRMSTMGKYATIQGIRYSTHPDQESRDLLSEMITACKPRGIRVIPYISTGHKLAWSTVTRNYPDYGQRTKPGGEPARDHMYVGEDMGTICWNTSYRQAYLDYVTHVVRDYDVSGMYFDTWRPFYFWPGKQLCYCDGCVNGFRKATGLELPWHEADSAYTPEELKTIDKYHMWYHEELIGILNKVREIVKSYKNIPLIYNINDPNKISREDPRIISSTAPPLIAWLGTTYGWQATFVIIGILGYLWVAAFWFTYYTPERSLKDSRARIIPPLRLIKNRFVASFTLSKVFTDPVWYFITFWIARYLVDVHHWGLDKIGLFAILPFVAADLGNILGGLFTQLIIRKGVPVPKARKIAVGIFGSIMGFSLISAPFVITSPAVALVVLGVAGFGYAAYLSNTMAFPADVVPHSGVASVYGLAGVGAGLGGAIFQSLSGIAVKNLSTNYNYSIAYNAVFVGYGILALLGLSIVLFFMGPLHKNMELQEYVDRGK